MSIFDGFFGRRKVKLTDPASTHVDHATWSGKATSPDAVLQLSTAWACVRLNARTKASLPLKLHSESDGSLIKDHQLYTILHDAPNADQTAIEFWEGMYTSLDLRGNAYAEKVFNNQGDLVALIPMNPDYVTVFRDRNTGDRRYRYSDATMAVYTPAEGWGEDKVFHLRGFGAGGLMGLSTISFGRQTLSTALAADEVAGRTFANGLQISGFATDVNAKANQEQREDLVKLFDKFAGSQRAGKVMPLPPGFDFKALNMSPEDAQLLETRGFHVEEICRWFGVFPILIGHAAAGQTMWGSGVEQINLAWLTLYLGPELQRIEQAIEKQLMKPADRAKFYVEHNVDALLRADSAGRAALYSVQAQNGIKTRNEIRKKENDPPMPGGDMLTVQSNLVPLDMLGTLEPGATPDGFGLPKPKEKNAEPEQPAPTKRKAAA